MNNCQVCVLASHPVWVRGLKQEHLELELHSYCVAPRVGAWIETSYDELTVEQAEVAPRVGAWIETISPSSPLKQP